MHTGAMLSFIEAGSQARTVIISFGASVGAGMLETMPDGLSRPCYSCEEPPCRQRFLDGRRRLHPNISRSVLPLSEWGSA